MLLKKQGPTHKGRSPIDPIHMDMPELASKQ